MENYKKHSKNYTESRIDPYISIGNLVGLSGVTIRKAFARKPITFRTAVKISRALGIPLESFRYVEDKRSRSKGKNDTKKA